MDYFRPFCYLFNWISLCFLTLLWYASRLCSLLLYSDEDNLGRRDLFISRLPHFLSSSSCFFVLFHSCCSHARVFGRNTLAWECFCLSFHELHISYSHTKWCIVFFCCMFFFHCIFHCTFSLYYKIQTNYVYYYCILIRII